MYVVYIRDKFTKEKADEAAFHPEHVIREGEPGYDPKQWKFGRSEPAYNLN